MALTCDTMYTYILKGIDLDQILLHFICNLFQVQYTGICRFVHLDFDCRSVSTKSKKMSLSASSKTFMVSIINIRPGFHQYLNIGDCDQGDIRNEEVSDQGGEIRACFQ